MEIDNALARIAVIEKHLGTDKKSPAVLPMIRDTAAASSIPPATAFSPTAIVYTDAAVNGWNIDREFAMGPVMQMIPSLFQRFS